MNTSTPFGLKNVHETAVAWDAFVADIPPEVRDPLRDFLEVGASAIAHQAAVNVDFLVGFVMASVLSTTTAGVDLSDPSTWHEVLTDSPSSMLSYVSAIGCVLTSRLISGQVPVRDAS